MSDVLIGKKISENIYWAAYNGFKYLHIDFANTEYDLDVSVIVRDLLKLLDGEAENSVRILSDVSEMDVSFNTQVTIRVISKEYQHLIKKSAFIGVGSILFPFIKVYRLYTGSKGVIFKTDE